MSNSRRRKLPRGLARLAVCLLSIICGCDLVDSGNTPRSDNSSGPPSDPLIIGPLTAPAAEVVTFGVFELALGAKDPGRNPYTHGPELKARFDGLSGDALGKRYEVSGFWDGENVWLIRFAPTEAGEWGYTTTSTDPGLADFSGKLVARDPTESELRANPLMHGFLQSDGFAWRLSDGSSFFPVGDTQWSFSEELHPEELKAWIDVLQQHGLNSLQGCIWLAKYDRGGLAPFAKRDPATDRLLPQYFQRLDETVRYANDRGVMLGLMIGSFPDNADWFDRFRTQERHDRWFRYVVARYAAFNVRWLLFGEVDERDPPWKMTSKDTVNYYADLVKKLDPWDHPIGSHHTLVDSIGAESPDIDYIEVQAVQIETQYERALEYRRWGKPLWFEEYWYESVRYDNEIERGLRNTHRNFVAALVFPTMGSLMRSHARDSDFPPKQAARRRTALAEYLLSTDHGLRRLGEFKAFYEPLDRLRFEPATKLCNRGVCGRFGSSFAIFAPGGGEVTIDLTQAPGNFSVRRLSIHEGEVRELGTIQGGERRTIQTGVSQDAAVLLLAEDD